MTVQTRAGSLNTGTAPSEVGARWSSAHAA